MSSKKPGHVIKIPGERAGRVLDRHSAVRPCKRGGLENNKNQQIELVQPRRAAPNPAKEDGNKG